MQLHLDQLSKGQTPCIICDQPQGRGFGSLSSASIVHFRMFLDTITGLHQNEELHLPCTLAGSDCVAIAVGEGPHCAHRTCDDESTLDVLHRQQMHAYFGHLIHPFQATLVFAFPWLWYTFRSSCSSVAFLCASV